MMVPVEEWQRLWFSFVALAGTRAVTLTPLPVFVGPLLKCGLTRHPSTYRGDKLEQTVANIYCSKLYMMWLTL